MSVIVTFYSYKGGVGRSMALANIAYELARRNKKTLIIDWDLEAPGLERYFSNFKIDSSSEGLLQLLLAFKNTIPPDYKSFISKININTEITISLLKSGRDSDPSKYLSQLESFNWDEFFTKYKGGLHLENLRNQWLIDFDVVLIDSRTGLSDSSGICTIMMPDILIPMFTANYQSLFGIRDTLKFIQNARQKLEIDRMSLTILPIPSRFGTRVEFKESLEWIDRIADILKECFSDWLPKWIEPKYIIEQIKIPQVDYFSFGEKLAVVEQGVSDPEGMGFIFSKIAALLSTDFTDLKSFIGNEYYNEKEEEYKNKTNLDSPYLYDVYISYQRTSYQWVRELLVPALSEYLNDDLGYKTKFYFDFNETELGESISSNMELALHKSKTLLYIIPSSNSTIDFLNSFSSFDLIYFNEREKAVNENLIFPIRNNLSDISNSSLPEKFKSKFIFDFSNYTYEEAIKSTKLRVQFGQDIEKLANSVANSIKSAQNIKGNNKDNFVENLPQDDNINELILLAKEYEDTRRSMPAGNQRTRIMESIFGKMKNYTTESLSHMPKFINSKSPGERLLAIAKLQKFPNMDYINWLTDHVGENEKPFVGFQASVAIYLTARAFGKKYKKEIALAIKKANMNIDKSSYKDPNQITNLKSAMQQLQL